MLTEVTYRWKVKWLGKWVTTRYHATESAIRSEHPEAMPVEHTRSERHIPESKVEMADQQRGLTLGALQRGHEAVPNTLQSREDA